MVNWSGGRCGGAAPAHGLESGTYAAPFDAALVFGATFDRVAESAPVQADLESRARNLAALQALSPDLYAHIDPVALQSRAALRAATPDRAPLAGCAPDATAATLRQSADAVHDGLYLLGGFGSRGFSLGPLLGERIVCEMLGEPQTLDAGVLEAAHPARFLVRALRRGPLNLA